MANIALLPIAPIILLPFIVLFFIVVFPLWLVALVVLGIALGVAWAVDALLRAAKVNGAGKLTSVVSNAFHWTLSWGGLAERRDRPR